MFRGSGLLSKGKQTPPTQPVECIPVIHDSVEFDDLYNEWVNNQVFRYFCILQLPKVPRKTPPTNLKFD